MWQAVIFQWTEAAVVTDIIILNYNLRILRGGSVWYWIRALSNSLLAALERILTTYLDHQNQNIRELNYNKEKMGDYGYLEIST